MKRILVGDLGGTKCAAGIVEYDTETGSFNCTQRHTVKLHETTSLEDLFATLTAHLDFPCHEADAICIGAAGQYDGEKLIYEGVYPYSMHFAQLAKAQRWPAYAIVHDYTPIVCATFTNYMDNEQNLKWLNKTAIQKNHRRVALGLGTGVGMKDGVLFPDGNFWLGTNEIGHIGINTAPHIDSLQLKRHAALMDFLQTRQPVTFEKILSGPGVVNLYQFLYPDQHKVSPEDIGMILKEGKKPELMELFAWYLGLLIGTVQLGFMPEGGVWITGGVALHHLELFDSPAFFAGIDASPAYLAQRKSIPSAVLCNPDHAFLGGAYYAVHRLIKNCL